jgi:glucose-1-phosphate thymidylyltransferase
MKGIILAGGAGSRLHPITFSISKQLLPVYDKPMIYYPLSVMMLAGIRDILIITTPEDQDSFKRLLSNGQQWGVKLSYAIQNEPKGIAEAFLIGEEFISNDSVCLILGDNIFHGDSIQTKLREAFNISAGARVFATEVEDPERFGVVSLDSNNNPISIVEKPKNPISNLAITGLYFYDNTVVSIAKSLDYSARGELEITDLNKAYLEKGLLEIEILSKDIKWIDTGTYESLIEAGFFIQSVQKDERIWACLEKIALDNDWIDIQTLKIQRSKFSSNQYSDYLDRVINDHDG